MAKSVGKGQGFYLAFAVATASEVGDIFQQGKGRLLSEKTKLEKDGLCRCQTKLTANRPPDDSEQRVPPSKTAGLATGRTVESADTRCAPIHWQTDWGKRQPRVNNTTQRERTRRAIFR